MSATSGFACPLCSLPTTSLLIRLRDFPALQNRLYESETAARAAPRHAADYYYCAACVYAFDPSFATRQEPQWEQYDNAQLASASYRAHVEEVVASLVKAWKLARPYAMSGDVHKRSWELGVFGQDVPDQYNKRISIKQIAFGAWIVRPRLDGRPKGDLPKIVAGASPAYDMTKYKAKIVSLEISGHE